MNYEVGSLWRKWDLHVHTPFSILNNQFGFDFDNYFYNLFSKAIANKIYVIGITDYYSIEGYKKVKEYLSDNKKLKKLFKKEVSSDSKYIEKIRNITVMPNIEFRLNTVISVAGKNNQSKLQVHVIFSDLVPVSDIETQFLNSIHFTNGQKEVVLTKNAVINYGKEMIESGACPPHEKDPEFVGYNQIAVDLNEIVRVLKNSFKGRYIIVGVEEDITRVLWRDQASAVRKNYYENCDAIFSSNPKSIKWFASKNAVITLKKKKACIWGSDSHSIEKLFETYENRFLWVKADTTFTGLKSAINSINERVFVGEIPSELFDARLRANYSIESVHISKNSGKVLDKKWFNMSNEIPLNPFMVTIIGNKGSGKSAIADVIAYLGNSYRLGKASFLNKQRFLKQSTHYYKDFKAEMRMYGKNHEHIKKDVLSNCFTKDAPEKVQFLPQKYIEEVCNDLGDEFQEEIDNVIYSYIRPENKLNSTNLKELIEIITKSIKNNIISKRTELNDINDSIVLLENKDTNEYKQKLNNQLTVQNERLKNHDANKPEVVEKPSDLETDSYSILDVKLSQYSTTIDEEIYKTQNKQSSINCLLNKISEFENSAKISVANLADTNNKYEELRKVLHIENSKKYVSYSINESDLNNKKSVLLKEYTEQSEILSDQFNKENIIRLIGDMNDYEKIVEESMKIKSLYARKYYVDSYKEKLQNLTSEKSKRYLQYVFNYNKWQNDRKMIIGDIPNNIDGESIKKYSEEIDYVKNKLPSELEELRKTRKQIINDICSEYEQLREVYQDIYTPIQAKIDTLLQNDEEKIEFKVNTYPAKDLASRIIEYMNQRVSSEFKGVAEGYEKINSFIKETNFDENSSILDFVIKIFEEVEKTKDINSFIPERIKFYNFLGGLDYLNVNYSLTLGEKNCLNYHQAKEG